MIPIVDCHHHLWDLGANRYPWLTHALVRPIYGDYSPIRRSYLIDEFLADTRDFTLLKSVHIEAGHDPADPVRESRWLQAVADAEGSGGFPHGIVAFADFRSQDVEAVLAGHASVPNVKGIRQLLAGRHDPWREVEDDPLREDDWRSRIGLLGKYGFSFDLQVYYQQMARAAELAAQHPDILFILNHAGMPARRDAEGLEGWRRGIRMLAARDNVVAKISGFGMVEPRWTTRTMRPFVLDMIDAFGVERCMFASNFPVDKIMRDYASLWRSYFAIVEDFTEAEKSALFSQNAIRTYRL
jgi:predicted TIM-barrel fold metal-dependent hydrolase